MLGVGAVIVVALVGLNIYITLKPAPKPAINQPLKDLLPPAPTGWKYKDEDIANTPEEKEQAEEVLHFDDAVYRVYSNGQTNLGIYIAHWMPGKFSSEKVGAHSPDTCWVHNGWDKLPGGQQGVEQQVAGGTLKKMETGTYVKDSQKVYVIFWHLVGQEPVFYDLTGWNNGLAGRIERLPALLSDFAQFGLDQRKEQLVLRISSDVPFDELWTDAGFATFMDQLGRAFDLYAKLPPSTVNPTSHTAAITLPNDVWTL
jgi:hypothetical protein